MKTEQIVIGVVLGASLGVGAVYLGEAMRWPHFQIRHGYFGTGFLNPFLHGATDRVVIKIIAAIWAFYGASIGLVIMALFPSSGQQDDG